MKKRTDLIRKKASDEIVFALSLQHWKAILAKLEDEMDTVKHISLFKKIKVETAKEDWRHDCALCEHTSLQQATPDSFLDCDLHCLGVEYGLFPERPYGCEEGNTPLAALTKAEHGHEILPLVRRFVQQLEETLKIVQEKARESWIAKQNFPPLEKGIKDSEVIALSIQHWEMVVKHTLEYRGKTKLRAVWRNEKMRLGNRWINGCAFCGRAKLEPRRPDTGGINCEAHCIGIKYKAFPLGYYACETQPSVFQDLTQARDDSSVARNLKLVLQGLKDLHRKVKELEAKDAS